MSKVLIVDDNVDMLDTLKHLFRFYEYEVFTAENGQLGIEAAKKNNPDIIVLDALMPVMNGFDACKILREETKTKDIPIIFLSANYIEEEHKIMGLEMGADDYIFKPFNAKELIAKVKSILHKKSLIENLRENNQQLIEEQNTTFKEIEELRRKNSELQSELVTDPLTGVYNKSFFEKRVKEEFLRSKRYKHPISLVLLDVDMFHKINDVFGEQTGDYILMRIANVILNNTRYTDIVFRMDNNRFLAVLPHTDESGAYYESERIRSAIDQTSFFDQDFYELKKLSPQRKQEYQHVTVSVGLVEVPLETTSDIMSALQLSEKALEHAKSLGRNQTIRYSKVEQE